MKKPSLIFALFTVLQIGWASSENTTNMVTYLSWSSLQTNNGIFLFPAHIPEAIYRIRAFGDLERNYGDLLSESGKRELYTKNLESRLSNAQAIGNTQVAINAQDKAEARRKQGRTALAFGVGGGTSGAGLALLADGFIRNEPLPAIIGGILLVGGATFGVVFYLDLAPKTLKN